jgi:tRNA1(Val) A37 N6-methylase TrmN6
MAKRGSVDLLRTWTGQLSGHLRHHGTLTLIVPAGMLPPCLSAMTDYACACTAVFPLWPKCGRPAKLVLLRGVKNARSPMRVMPGLVLHEADGSFTDAAQAIFNDNAAITLEA